MQAITFSQFGGPEVLTLAEIDAPVPGSGQVRVAVRVAAVNAFDWKVRRGLMAPALPKSFPAVPGYDVAGVVDELGDGVSEFAVGDEVMGACVTGAYAQFAVAEVAGLVHKPETVSWEVAGGFDSVARTANRVLNELGVEAGSTVLVHGASGSVGQLAVQLARHRGANVVGSASQANQERIRALGATPIVYGDGFADRASAAAPNGVDFAADLAGRGDLPALIALVGSPDRVLTIADPAAAENGVRFSSGARGAASDRQELVDLLAHARLSLAVEQAYPLAGAALAQERSESGHAGGRLVLVVA